MECRAVAEKAVPQTPLSLMMLYLPVSLADFLSVVQQAVTIFRTRAQGLWRGCLDTPFAASKVWLLRLPGEGQLFWQHHGAQGRVRGAQQLQAADRQAKPHQSEKPYADPGWDFGEGLWGHRQTAGSASLGMCRQNIHSAFSSRTCVKIALAEAFLKL